jgi:hypothetical protein
MSRRGLAAVVALILSVSLSSAAHAAGEGGQSPSLTKEQAARVLSRLLEREPFWPGHYDEAPPETLGKFFTDKDYKVLQGNPFLGYWNSGEFLWSDRKAIAWGGILGVGVDGGARSLGSKAWRAAMEVVASKRGLVLDDRAAVRIEGRCLRANLAKTSDGKEPPGVLLELRMDSPKGVLRVRLAVGKPTVEEAMGAALDWVTGFALRVHHPVEEEAVGGGR